MISGPACRLLITAASIFYIAGLVSGSSPEDEESEESPADVNRRFSLEQRRIFFDQQMYQGQNPQDARKGLENRMKRRLGEINKLCDLTPDQSQKLELAGHLDIKRLFDRIEAHRREFENRDVNAAAVLIMPELEPLRISYALSSKSIFLRERSLLHKTALATLLPDQLDRYQSEMATRHRSRLATVHKSVLKVFNGRKSLDDDQRRELLVLWNELPCATSGPVDAMVFLHLASRIPEKKYRDILDESQWDVLQSRFATAKHYGPALVQLGVIDDLQQDNP